MEKKKVLVLFGGQSSEHEVSRVSASNVAENMDENKYDVITLGITKDGRWLLYKGDTEAMRDGKWENDARNEPFFLSPDATIGGIISTNGTIIPIDVVFPVLHGRFGEDGTVQGLLELARIAYVGCPVAASAIGMDKMFSKVVFDWAGIAQAKWTWLLKYEIEKNLEECVRKIEAKFAYPIFVKPANAGSSVGITKANDGPSLQKALKIAAEHDEKIIIEEAIAGREIECAVIGNEEPFASPCAEIFPGKEFYDYEAKYQSTGSKTKVPADLPKELQDKIRVMACRVYSLLGCKGMSRVDFFVRGEDVLVNEINTIPGFTAISMYPMMMQEAKIPYGQLIDELINYALLASGGAEK